MKKIFTIFTSLIISISAFPLYSQTPDIIIDTEFDSVAETYLLGKEAEYDFILQNPMDNEATMKAYIGKFIVHFFLTQVDGRKMVEGIGPHADSLGENFDSLGAIIEDEFIPLFEGDINQFLINLEELFLDPRYTNLRDRLNEHLDMVDMNIDSVGSILADYFDKMEDHMQIMGDNLEAAMDGTAEFSYVMKFVGIDKEDSVFIINRASLNNFEDYLTNIEDAFDALDDAVTGLDSLMDLGGGNTDPVIADFRNSVALMDAAASSLEILFSNDPFTPLDMDLTFIYDFQDILSAVDSVLDGKEFDMENEGKTFRPVGLIENLPYGYFEIFKDFYRTPISQRAGFTFGNIFPNGIPSDGIDFLEEDMIINNSDDYDVFIERMAFYADHYSGQLSVDPMDTDANLGWAIAKTYLMIDDLTSELDEFIQYMEGGNFIDILDRYSWQSFNHQATLDSIKEHFDYALEDDDLFFMILMKDNYDPGSQYVINQESEFGPYPLMQPHVQMINMYAHMIAEIREGIFEAINEMYSEIDLIFDMDLDPNMLDFSNTEDFLDIIAVLESSNPDFMKLTQYGHDKFIEAGNDLFELFSDMSETIHLFNNVIIAMAVHEDDLGMDGEGMKNMSQAMDDMFYDMKTDFEFPDSTMMMDDLRVNLSAWFDNPPPNFLTMIKWFIDGDDNTDNTLGGLFPDGIETGIENEDEEIPEEFVLMQNYPNPFNPSTRISFAIPEISRVKLEIYNLLGERIAVLIDGEMNAGYHTSLWHAVDRKGAAAPSGIYFYTISINDGKSSYRDTKKLMLLK